MSLLLFWIIAIAVGYFLGAGKNRGLTGAVLSGVLGPIGWLIVVFLPNRTPGHLAPGVHPATASPVSTTMPSSMPPVPQTTGEEHFHVARGGRDLGPMTVRRIRQLLTAGQLERTDTYFDPQLNSWVALDLLPE